MDYGFVIDNRKCIGCHACSVACKAENQVPVGSNRTWVKYIEKGTYPDARRLFSVNRCNHCANPPCVTICPVTALYKRTDGIVDFDQDRCIGCKACMQACPYDALYIHPDLGTAQKCHYCAHRIEQSLEPSCVIVCPTHAIVSGDMDDPTTEIAQLLARQQTTVRKPEQGTRPKLYYIEGDSAMLTPTAAPPAAEYMWTSQPDHGGGGFLFEPGRTGERRWSGAELRADRPLGQALAVAPHAASAAITAMHVPAAPLFDIHSAIAARYPPARAVTGRARVRRTHDVAHEKPWGAAVSMYIFTKSIAAGTFLIAALLVLLGRIPSADELQLVGVAISLLFTTVTAVLLVADLERPERFLSVLLRPQWRSWLAIGSYILTAYSLLLVVWLGAWCLGLGGLLRALLWPGIALAIGSAIYTAFLFAQAEGRDFWQSPALAPSLLLHAIAAGAATLLLTAALVPEWRPLVPFLGRLLGVTLAIDLFVILAGELYTPHASADAAAAARLIVRGPYARRFWWIVVGLGHVAAIVLLLAASASPVAMVTAALLAGLGLVTWSDCFVEAGQAIPLS